MKIIDLRSDTVTQQTQAMRDAMLVAEVGDESTATIRRSMNWKSWRRRSWAKRRRCLSHRVRWAISLALMAHTNRGDEVIVSADCHIFEHGSRRSRRAVRGQPAYAGL